MQINLLRQQKIVRAELTELDRGLLHTFNNLNHIFYPLAQRGAMLKVIVIIMTVHEHVSEFGRSLPPALAWTEYAWMRIRETGAGDLVWHSLASPWGPSSRHSPLKRSHPSPDPASTFARNTELISPLDFACRSLLVVIRHISKSKNPSPI